MTINFNRVECPHCKWGYPWLDKLANTGWHTLKCEHCDGLFYHKVTIMGVLVETTKDYPTGFPCHNLSGTKSEN